ncbi:DUF2076 domain-containing protein [Thiocapsa marina]|uniref:Putative periplasmic ligand-binding sensor protein n=1 Tax=Thiocapsa marina 5811 TaxID=768671 RepID=F9U5I8_9GAMM|nr:DUF2076 domain-containing protein [Thiocapsa marina]EGV20411.1 putative periplasmic ligand-binding sensor protein [Thiocapsa marina 5811]
MDQSNTSQNEQRLNEQRIIDDLFGKLRQAEHQTGPRDPAAEQQIAAALEHQPAAPYYMAQAILVQERAIETLGQRVQDLEQELASRPAGGGFLDSLFGAPSSRAGAPGAPAGGALGRAVAPSGMGLGGMQPGQAHRAGGGFLGSALQTAVAVAGGVMMANVLTGLFAAEEAQAAEEPVEDPGLDSDFDPKMMDDGDMGDFDGFDDF